MALEAGVKSLRFGDFKHFSKCFVEGLCAFEISQWATAPIHLNDASGKANRRSDPGSRKPTCGCNVELVWMLPGKIGQRNGYIGA